MPAQGNLHGFGYSIATSPPQTLTTAFPGQGFPISQSQIVHVRGKLTHPAECTIPVGTAYLLSKLQSRTTFKIVSKNLHPWDDTFLVYVRLM
jgi:hypothetical protein